METRRAAGRVAMAEANYSLLKQAAELGLDNLVSAGRVLNQVSADQTQMADAERYVLQSKKMDASRQGPYEYEGTLHLPKAGKDKAPMLRDALLNLFPAVPPSSPWELKEIGSYTDPEKPSKKERLLVVGPGMSQRELDVFLGAIVVTSGSLDQVVEINPTVFLKSIGRGSNKKSIANLFRIFTKIRAHDFYYEVVVDGKRTTKSSDWKLIEDLSETAQSSRGCIKAHSNIKFSVSSRFAKFFRLGFGRSWTRIDLCARRRLDGNQRLALWLQAYLSAFPCKHFRDLEKLATLSGTNIARLSNFKIDLKQAARELKAIGFLKSEPFERDENGKCWFHFTKTHD